MGFTGQEYDAETDLYHYRARVYDPDVGRFVQSDAIGFAAGDLNLYAYTWNDPSNWSDPSGLALTSNWTIRSAAAVRLASRAVTGVAKKVAKEMVEQSIEDATLCLASNAASVIGSFAANYAVGGQMFDPDDPIKRVAECASEVMPLCGCKGGGVGAGSSFVPGTEVLTPDGKVAIEDLREGDLVMARHEITGELGEFLVRSDAERCRFHGFPFRVRPPVGTFRRSYARRWKTSQVTIIAVARKRASIANLFVKPRQRWASTTA